MPIFDLVVSLSSPSAVADPDLGLEKEIAKITGKTKDIAWDDLTSLLKLDLNLNQRKSKFMLVGRLVSKKIHLKQVIFPVIRLGWRFLK